MNALGELSDAKPLFFAFQQRYDDLLSCFIPQCTDKVGKRAKLFCDIPSIFYTFHLCYPLCFRIFIIISQNLKKRSMGKKIETIKISPSGSVCKYFVLRCSWLDGILKLYYNIKYYGGFCKTKKSTGKESACHRLRTEDTWKKERSMRRAQPRRRR